MNKTLAWLLLSTSALLSAAAWAGPTESLWLAQLTPEERQRLRERWENASPEQRAAVRQELRERWNEAPPELREQQRQRMMEQLNRAPPREQWQEPPPNRLPRDGFGAGFEQRRIENEGPRRPPRPGR